MGRWFAGLVAVSAAAALCPFAGAARPLQTAVAEQPEFGGPDAELAFARTRAAGATAVRLTLNWATAAGRQPADPASPDDPAYDWKPFDARVRLAVSDGLEPIVSFDDAPRWAQDESKPLPFQPPASLRGPVRPRPDALGQFARAAAARYSGSFAGLPRVRLWRVWNEPNLSSFLLPQFDGQKALSPDLYRSLLNRAARSIHAVHADNVVIAGSLSPYGTRTTTVQAVAPLRFMRELLCMSAGKKPRATCSAKAEFDVWGAHPYTSGGATRKASSPDDVSLGDLPEVRSLLDAARRAGHVVSREQPRLWVLEFSWDTNPPDFNHFVLPVKLHARWVAEALYRMWRSGVTLVTWLQLRDDPYPSKPSQSGLYFRGGDSLTRDAPKPALAAFRFPFVAYRAHGGADVWGRTPAGRPANVLVEENAGFGWRRLARLRTDRYGIFERRIHLAATTHRASAPPAKPLSQTSTYRQLVLRDSPTSYWPLDEPTGMRTARDLTGVRDARYEGAKAGAPGALLGTLDRAVALDGKNDRVALGRVASPRTVELWVKTQARYEAAAFSNRGDSSRFTFVGVVDAIRARVFDTVGLSGRSWITDGRWHHLAYTYDGLTARLYVDGRLDASASFARVEGSADAWLGFDATLKTYLSGSVDEVALYDYPLAESQIRDHFLASGRTLAYGSQFAIMTTGTYLRARLENGQAASLPFSLARPPDRFVLPFGL